MFCTSDKRHLARKLCQAHLTNRWIQPSNTQTTPSKEDLIKNWEENSELYNHNFIMYLCCTLTEQNARDLFETLKDINCCPRHKTNFPESIQSCNYDY